MNIIRKLVSHREKVSVQFDIINYGASCGACFVAAIQLSSVPHLTTALSIAIYCFSVAIPFLLGAFIARSTVLYRRVSNMTTELVTHLFGVLGLIGAATGISSIFFSFGLIVGGVFALSLVTVIAVLIKIVPIDKELESKFNIRTNNAVQHETEPD